MSKVRWAPASPVNESGSTHPKRCSAFRPSGPAKASRCSSTDTKFVLMKVRHTEEIEAILGVYLCEDDLP